MLLNIFDDPPSSLWQETSFLRLPQVSRMKPMKSPLDREKVPDQNFQHA